MNFYIIDDNREIYDLRPEQDTNAQYRGEWCEAWAIDRVNGNAKRCPLCGRPVFMRRWEAPRKMRLTNTHYPDRLTDWLIEPLVVSDRFMNAFQEEKLTGILSFSEIEVVNFTSQKRKKKPAPRYFWTELCYSESVRVDVQKTVLYGQKYDWSCALCNPFGSTCDKIERMVLDTERWDGTDVFQVYSVGTVCSQRFFDFVADGGFTNFNLVPISAYRR